MIPDIHPEDVFPVRLKAAMAAADISAADLAERSGTNRNGIRIYLCGRGVPSAFILARMAATLQVSCDWLLGLVENKEDIG